MFDALFNGMAIESVSIVITISLLFVILFTGIGITIYACKAGSEHMIFNLLLIVPGILLIAFLDITEDHRKVCVSSFTEKFDIESDHTEQTITVILTFRECRYRTHYGENFGPFEVEYLKSNTVVY